MSRATRTSLGPRATSHELQRSSSQLVARSSQLLLALIGFVVVQAQRSPFNNLEVLPADSTGHYRILIGGHFHGESTNRSGYPAATLLANLDTINSLGANLFLSTGDLFMDPVNDMPRYQRALFSKLKMPLFNAPGNHDVSRLEGERLSDITPKELVIYASDYGGLRQLMGSDAGQVSRHTPDSLLPQTKLEDIKKQLVNAGLWGKGWAMDRVLIWDLESQKGNVSSEQLGSLMRFTELAEEHKDELDRLFIISHRPIWSEDDPQYSPLFKDNTRSLTGTNFQKDVYPLLEKIAEHAHVYWISGSLGGSAPSSIFFQEHAKNITYIQCAIRDEPRDALLIANVYPDTVKWSSFSLTGQKLLAPEAYSAAWWREHIGKSEGFNWRLLPYLVKTTVLRKEFWWGVLGGVLVLMLIRRFYRR